MRIGVLSLQGGFVEHISMLKALHVDSFEIRNPSHLDKEMDGLILPGGESTVIGRLLNETSLLDPLETLIKGGLPVFGTCAGMILLANSIENSSSTYLPSIGVTVRRNAYGRQLGSFHTEGNFSDIGVVPMTFIRAPYIVCMDEEVRTLAMVGGNIIAAESHNILVTSFHPELTTDLRVHKYFLRKVQKQLSLSCPGQQNNPLV